MSEKITAMIEEIKGLTVLELSELVHALEEEFGVSAAAMAVIFTASMLSCSSFSCCWLMAGRIPTVHRISVSRDDKCKE